MARTNLTDKQIRAPYNKANNAAIVAKHADFDRVSDVLLPYTAASAGTKSRAYVYTVRAVSVANIADLTSVSTTLDGLTLVAGDRVLLTAQSTGAQNGPYVVGTVATGTAPLTRAVDCAESAVIPTGSMFIVDAGTAGAGRVYKLTNTGTVTVGTTAMTFGLISTTQQKAQAATTLSGAGAVPITGPTCNFTSTGAGNALTVADGLYAGQRVTVVHIVKGSSGTGVITQTTGAKLTAGITTITLSTLYASITLEWDGSVWNPATNAGCTIA